MSISSFVSNFTRKILTTIQENHLIEPGDGVVIGVSGGHDSVCLLHVLQSLVESLQLKLYAVHINHMLRGKEADADEEYTVDLCNRLGIPISIVRIDIAAYAAKLGLSIEEAGREARYREFKQYASAVGASKIAVAHNRNDQAETVFMHIIRGTGTAGLSGMEYKRDCIIRPLLGVSRDEIECYCQGAGLHPRTDSSNLEQDFTRNKVRLALFPYINEKFDANIVESLWRLSQNASVDERFMEKCTSEAYERVIMEKGTGFVCLDIRQMQKLDPAIGMRILRIALKNISGSAKGVGGVHYRALTDLINKGRTGTMAQLPRGIRATVSYGVLKLLLKSSLEQSSSSDGAFSLQIALPGETFIPILNSNIRTSIIMPENIDKYSMLGYNPKVQYFDYDKVKQGIYIRNRRNGDIFKPLGSPGTKKLKEFYIDSKVPREKRGMIPLIVIGNEVVWIIGHKISDKFRVTENTKSVLKMEYIEGGRNES